MNKWEEISNNLNSEDVIEHLKKLKDSEIYKHYSPDSDEVLCSFKNEKDVVDFLVACEPITIDFSSREVTYSLSKKGVENEIFDIDISKSFSISDTWLYDKLHPVNLVFPNAVDSELSSEQKNLYICLVISGVLGDIFEEEFLELVSNYDFQNWESKGESTLSFTALCKEWVQMDSIIVKMVASAARFALSREKAKKEIPTALGLSEAEASELRNLMKRIEDERYNYDNNILSDEKKKGMSKLDIKIKIREMNTKISDILKENPRLHELYKLTNLNSRNINPIVYRDSQLKSKKEAVRLFQKFSGREVRDDKDKLEVSKIAKTLMRESMRACVNKLFSEEAEIYRRSPDNYKAPDFV